MTPNIYCLYVEVNDVVLAAFDLEKTYGKSVDYGQWLFTTFNGRSLPSDWHCPGLSWEPEHAPLQDFVWGDRSAPFVSERVFRCMQPLLDGYADFHFVGMIRDAKYYVLNVVHLLDCLDLDKSEGNPFTGRPGEFANIYKHVFREDMSAKIASSPVFKIPQCTKTIYATDLFVDAVRANNLTGVGFEFPDKRGVTRRNDVFPDLPLKAQRRK